MDMNIPTEVREHPKILELEELAIDLIVIANVSFIHHTTGIR